eukprot:14712-Pelagococcus_subviridis.AAC.1
MSIPASPYCDIRPDAGPIPARSMSSLSASFPCGMRYASTTPLTGSAIPARSRFLYCPARAMTAASFVFGFGPFGSGSAAATVTARDRELSEICRMKRFVASNATRPFTSIVDGNTAEMSAPSPPIGIALRRHSFNPATFTVPVHAPGSPPAADAPAGGSGSGESSFGGGGASPSSPSPSSNDFVGSYSSSSAPPPPPEAFATSVASSPSARGSPPSSSSSSLAPAAAKSSKLGSSAARGAGGASPSPPPAPASIGSSPTPLFSSSCTSCVPNTPSTSAPWVSITSPLRFVRVRSSSGVSFKNASSPTSASRSLRISCKSFLASSVGESTHSTCGVSSPRKTRPLRCGFEGSFRLKISVRALALYVSGVAARCNASSTSAASAFTSTSPAPPPASNAAMFRASMNFASALLRALFLGSSARSSFGFDGFDLERFPDAALAALAARGTSSESDASSSSTTTEAAFRFFAFPAGSFPTAVPSFGHETSILSIASYRSISSFSLLSLYHSVAVRFPTFTLRTSALYHSPVSGHRTWMRAPLNSEPNSEMDTSFLSGSHAPWTRCEGGGGEGGRRIVRNDGRDGAFFLVDRNNRRTARDRGARETRLGRGGAPPRSSSRVQRGSEEGRDVPPSCASVLLRVVASDPAGRRLSRSRIPTTRRRGRRAISN